MELDKTVREDMILRLQRYLDTELGVEMGNFDVEFLLDFFSKELGYRFYNQGLNDALKAFEGKVLEYGELLYELEKTNG